MRLLYDFSRKVAECFLEGTVYRALTRNSLSTLEDSRVIKLHIQQHFYAFDLPSFVCCLLHSLNPPNRLVFNLISIGPYSRSALEHRLLRMKRCIHAPIPSTFRSCPVICRLIVKDWVIVLCRYQLLSKQ